MQTAFRPPPPLSGVAVAQSISGTLQTDIPRVTLAIVHMRRRSSIGSGSSDALADGIQSVCNSGTDIA